MHLSKLFDWREWIEQLCDEGIVQRLVVFGEWRLRHNSGLIVWRGVIVLLFTVGSTFTSFRWALYRHSGILKLFLFFDLLGGKSFT